jgi:hypothetical protein
LSEHPVSYYAVEYGIKHTVLNNAIRDFMKGKPWGLKARRVPMTTMYTVAQIDFDVWYARHQQNKQKRESRNKMDYIEQIEQTSFIGLKFDNGSFLCIACLDVMNPMPEENIINAVQAKYETSSSLKCIKCNRLFMEQD